MNGFKVFVVAAVGALAMLALPAVAAAKDRNHDHIPDRWEVRHHLSLHRNQARLDQDHDHLRNRAEFLAGDNPRNPDTDNDGIMDGEENAGTIQSFDQETGKLTISLFGGETISGMVDEGDNGENEGEDSGDHQGEEAGDDNGEEQGEEAGDDNGENQGEDHGGEPGEGDQGEDHGGEPGEGDQGGNEGNCTTADLTEGAVVKEADLHVSNGQAVFEKVELAG
jgi:hypothetical protein